MEEEIENTEELDMFECFNPIKTNNNLNSDKNVNKSLLVGESSCLLSQKNGNFGRLRDKKLEKYFELQNILFQLQDQDELLHKKIKKTKKELRQLQMDIQRENSLVSSDLSLSHKVYSLTSPNNLSLESSKSQDSALSTSMVSSIQSSFDDGLYLTDFKNIPSKTGNVKWLKKKEIKENDITVSSTNVGVLTLFLCLFCVFRIVHKKKGRKIVLHIHAVYLHTA
jgi:hypothetical protein